MQMVKFSYTCLDEHKNIREYLNRYHLSKTKIYKLISEKKIWINGRQANENTKVNCGDEVVIEFPMKLDTKKSCEKLDIVYEDEHILLINKPVGILVHSDGSEKITLDNIVQNYLPNIDPMHVHRLDMETSGIIMYAKDPLALSFFQDELSRHEIKREYLALCCGKFTENEGKINKSIGTHRHINGKMVIYKNGKTAVTNYKVVKQFSNYALVSLILETGRTHQIRVHMSSIGHPLVNDILYGGKNLKGRIALHSHKISYYNPFTKKREHFTCNLPKDLVEYTM